MTGLPRSVGVYGGGRMGGGIAHAFAVSGADVVVVEADPEAAAAARSRIEASMVRARATHGAGGGVTVTSDPAELADCALVVEAVPEDIELKTSVLQKVQAIAPRADLASNTSSLPISRIAQSLDRPDRFIGLHFFNPVPSSALVEVVVGADSGTDLVEAASAWVAALGKTAITVRDSPGFASSRLGVLLALEAIRMLETEVASAEDIDAAMTLGYRHPLGPLRTTDLVGLDVRLSISRHLQQELGDRFAPPALLVDLVDDGRLGRKVGRGFFDW